MFVVGLTGGIATGKSTVLSIFKEHGIGVIDADEVARQVVEPGTKGWKQIKEYFGDEILYADGRINRTLLGEIVFNDITKRKKLNAITHPLIHKTMLQKTFEYLISGDSYIVIELPLLFEIGTMVNFMHKIITVVCNNDQQLQRLLKRSGLSEEMAVARINAQMPIDQKVAKSDFAIDNSGDFEQTRRQTENVIKVLNNSNFNRYWGLLLAGMLTLVISGCYYLKMLIKD